MGIEIDFISVVIGYIIGVFLTWSLTFTLFGCEKCKDEEDSSNYYFEYDYDTNRYHKRIM